MIRYPHLSSDDICHHVRTEGGGGVGSLGAVLFVLCDILEGVSDVSSRAMHRGGCLVV